MKPALYINEKTLLDGNGGDTFWDTEVSWWPEDGFVPLYTHPAKTLTNEEIETLKERNQFLECFYRTVKAGAK